MDWQQFISVFFGGIGTTLATQMYLLKGKKIDDVTSIRQELRFENRELKTENQALRKENFKLLGENNRLKIKIYKLQND